MSDDEALRDMRAEYLDAGGIDVSEAVKCAARIRAKQAAGYPLTRTQILQAEACEQRIRLAETFATPKELPL